MVASGYPARYWHALEDGRVQCDLCPRGCRLKEGRRGFCFVRQARGGRLVLTTYGRTSGCAIDPIEKKPLNHFLPGSGVLSFGTVGCNLACVFCQNWHISHWQEDDVPGEEASPEALAQAAVNARCRSVAFTYNEPIISLEYAVDTARRCHELGIRTVAVTAGEILAEPRAEFFGAMDAANVDLKAFTEEFYRKYCGGELAPVKETLRHIARTTKCWLEVTTLVIPGANDGEAELRSMAEWIAAELGSEVPLHLSAFHPAGRMHDRPATSAASLVKARELARQSGLKHVYTGNVADPAGQSTYCASCSKLLIERDRYSIGEWNLKPDATCRFCGARLAGVFEA